MARGCANPSSHMGDREPVGSRARALLTWLGLAAALAVAFLLDGVVMAAVKPLHDGAVAELINDTIRWLGTGYVQAASLLVAIGVGACLRRPLLGAAAWTLFCFAVSGASALILKGLVHRPRPWTEASTQGWSDYLTNSEFHSFPSGESTTTFAVAAALAWSYPRWRAPLFGVAAAIAAARVVVGVHYPSDVVAGALLGVGVAELVRRAVRRKRRGGSGAEPEQAPTA